MKGLLLGKHAVVGQRGLQFFLHCGFESSACPAGVCCLLSWLFICFLGGSVFDKHTRTPGIVIGKLKYRYVDLYLYFSSSTG